MNFKLINKKGVIDYLKEYIKRKDTDEKRVNNIKHIFKRIKDGDWKILFAFENNYGEEYLAIQDFTGKTIWFGDESDWGGGSSFFEDAFMNSHINNCSMNEVLSAGIVEIKKEKLNEKIK